MTLTIKKALIPPQIKVQGTRKCCPLKMCSYGAFYKGTHRCLILSILMCLLLAEGSRSLKGKVVQITQSMATTIEIYVYTIFIKIIRVTKQKQGCNLFLLQYNIILYLYIFKNEYIFTRLFRKVATDFLLNHNIVIVFQWKQATVPSKALAFLH